MFGIQWVLLTFFCNMFFTIFIAGVVWFSIYFVVDLIIPPPSLIKKFTEIYFISILIERSNMLHWTFSIQLFCFSVCTECESVKAVYTWCCKVKNIIFPQYTGSHNWFLRIIFRTWNLQFLFLVVLIHLVIPLILVGRFVLCLLGSIRRSFLLVAACTTINARSWEHSRWTSCQCSASAGWCQRVAE